MRKLKLEVEKLRVDSFRTDDGAAAGRGTVHAHAPTDALECLSVDFCTDVSVCLCNTTHTAQYPECGGISDLCT